MLNSLVICLFARKVYDRKTIIEAFGAIGVEMTDEELDDVAKRTFATKLRIKKKLGFDLVQVKLPKRFFETPAIHYIMKEKTAMEIILKYRERLNELEVYE